MKNLGYNNKGPLTIEQRYAVYMRYMVWRAPDSDIASAKRGRGIYMGHITLRYVDRRNRVGDYPSKKCIKGPTLLLPPPTAISRRRGENLIGSMFYNSAKGYCDRKKDFVIGRSPMRSEEGFLIRQKAIVNRLRVHEIGGRSF